MRVAISLAKDANMNAAHYYAESKRYKRKLAGLSKGVEALERKISAHREGEAAQAKHARVKRERKWYEKFHWFFTSEGFLVISGKDAKSNEIVVTKFMDEKDIYFHADIHGASHTVLKTGAESPDAGGKMPGEISKEEAAKFAAVFSSAWREKIPGIDVYSARPEQVTKSAPTGESIGSGAFMVYGEREWRKKTPLEFAIGFRDAGKGMEFFSGPPGAVKSRADFFVRVDFGPDSKGDCAKKLAKIFSVRIGAFSSTGAKQEVNIDDLVALLPSGGMKAGYLPSK